MRQLARSDRTFAMNEIFVKMHSARAAAVVEASRSLGDLQHEPLKGQLREILIQDFLRPLLPPQLGIAHGVIVSSENQQSREQDIIIYDKALAPPAFVDAVNGVVPVDSVLYTIEVKSTLDLDELRKTHDSAAELIRFAYVGGRQGPDGKLIVPETAISCLFAYRTNLTSGEDEWRRYQALTGTDTPAIRAICVAGRGYWFWSDRNGWEQGFVSSQLLILSPKCWTW